MSRLIDTTTWRFGDFELHVHDRRLLQAGQPVHLQARALDLLVALVDRRGQLLRRSDILDTVWAGLVVEDNNINVQVNALRKVLGRAAIVTVPGDGYRLGEVLLPVVLGAGSSMSAPTQLPSPSPSPSLAVPQGPDEAGASPAPDGPKQRFISRLSQSADLLFGDWPQPAPPTE